MRLGWKILSAWSYQRYLFLLDMKRTDLFSAGHQSI